MVAGRCAHTTLGITIDRQSGYVEHASSYAFVGLSLTTHTQGKRIPHKLIGIEASDAVAIGDRGEVDQIDEGVYLIQLLALKHATDKLFAGRTIARGILAAGLIDTSSGSDTGQILQTLCGQLLTKIVLKSVDLIPEFLRVGRVYHLCLDSSPHKFRTDRLDLL